MRHYTLNKDRDDRPLLVTVFCDASLKDGIVGWGYWIKSSEVRVEGSGACRLPGTKQCSSVAEFLGLVDAVKAAHTAHPDRPIDIVLQCDNINALQWCANFGKFAKKSELKRKPCSIPNVVSVNAAELSVALTGNLWLKHVRGHSSGCTRTGVNNHTDTLARKAREEFEQRIKG